MAIGFLRLLTLRAQRPFLPCPIFHFQLTAALAMPPSGKRPFVSRRAVQIEYKGLSRFRECVGQPWRWLRGDERYPRCAYGICAVCRVES